MGDSSWVFDSLICFLHGPVWNAPLQTFIEEKSLIFNSNEISDTDTDPDPSYDEYRQIYDDYKNLVDYMLGSFMEEMEITPEQFELACFEGRNQQEPDNPFSFHQGLFQQIWAANDIKIFVKMMTQRNVEIQLQALDLIECNQSFNSTVEVNNECRNKNITNNCDSDSSGSNIKYVEAAVIKEIEKESDIVLEPIKTIISNDEQQTKKVDRLNLFFEHQEISPEEIKLRQEYLRAQRDKIIEIKKNVRTKNLNDSIAKRVNRPSSVRMAQKILEGKNEKLVPISDDQSASFQLRKTLAKRLRSEVVEKN